MEHPVTVHECLPKNSSYSVRWGCDDTAIGFDVFENSDCSEEPVEEIITLINGGCNVDNQYEEVVFCSDTDQFMTSSVFGLLLLIISILM